MILPILAYGDPVLRKKCDTIDKDYEGLDTLLESMFETMYAASGVGLAAPQVGLPIRLFIVDATPFGEDEELSEEERKELETFKKVFINAKVIDETGDEWAFNEGCLSIPDVREDVFRPDTLHIEYMDENFKKHKETFTGMAARVIQHEYDHIEGILFTDKLSPLKKRLIKSRLTNITKGNIKVDYRMRFPAIKKGR
ncbi:peptide deformylase [Ascidiimonas sp. W6]|uniref:peptide deformylase n=1 Tax=Ascidiimonas meishanensis TaxID=3128903 RepID=UPI0030ECD794